MPWEQRFFKGKKVWVFVDESGEPVIDNGRVSMRYTDSEQAKLYHAYPQNISVNADSGQPPASSKSGNPPNPGTKSSSKDIETYQVAEQPGSRIVSEATPADLANEALPEQGVVEVHTDGACSGNPGPCGYGVVIREGERYEEISAYLGIGTNNIGELMAIKVALEAIEDRHQKVQIYTDSTYCIGVLTKGWKAKVNRELIEEIKLLMKTFDDLQLIKIKGHAGFPLNERADYLATTSLRFADTSVSN